MKNENKHTASKILKNVDSLAANQIKWRRHLHQYPEVAYEEHQTTAFLKKQVQALGLKLLPLSMETGLLAELKGNKPGPTVAVRTDIDALPILEATGLPFSSKIDGRMHACGHDMHMATILGTATALASLKKDFSGTVRFIFQPAEEVPPGGARPMIANGALKDVEMIFGLHVDPHVPTGKIGLRDGVIMASVYDFDIIIKGQSGHAARPHLAVDSIVVAAEVIESLQKVISREMDPVQPAAITFGQIQGGTARNVIADQVSIIGTARTLSEDAFKKIPLHIKRTLAGICKARGADFEIREIANYPLLKNHPQTNRLFEKNFNSLYGKGKVLQTEPTLGGEDFACYLEQVPGAMFRLGVMNKKIKADKSWHSPQFICDEAALAYGTSLLVSSVLDYMENNGR